MTACAEFDACLVCGACTEHVTAIGPACGSCVAGVAESLVSGIA